MRSLTIRLATSLLLSLIVLTPVIAGEPRQIDVRITSHLGDQQKFVAGDHLSFLLSLERDSYVYLFYRDAAGNLLQLLPNARMQDHFFNKGLFMPVPSAQQSFQFTVQPPYGDEIMYAVASDNGFMNFPGEILANGLILLSGDFGSVVAAIKANSSQLFGHGQFQLTTLPDQQAE